MSSGEDLPTLSADGTVVVFSSLDAFRRQYEASLRHGAILVRSPPIAIGTRKQLTVRIEELAVSYRVHCTAQYRTDDAIGFSIERFSEHKEWFRSVAEEIE